MLVHPCSAFCEGFGNRLSQGGHDLAGYAQDADSALPIIKAQPIDIVFVGSNENKHDSLRWCRVLHQNAPTLRILILSTQADDPGMQLVARRAGAVGCISPNFTTAAEYLAKVDVVMAGHTLFSHEVITRAQASRGLTPRELEVVRLMAEGKSYKQIAAELTVSEHTVRNHARSIMDKLGVKDRYEAVEYARQQGWVR